MRLTPEQLKDMDDKVREIGKYLGMEFDAKGERDWDYRSELKNGNRVISFHTSDYKLKDRWQISASFPRDNKGQSQTGYNESHQEITVSMSKSAEKIAKDIKSRLLPEYERRLAAVMIRIESSNKYSDGRLAQIQKVAEFLGMKKPTDDRNTCLFPGGAGGVYKIEPYNETTVKFDIEVGADRAIEILKILGYGEIKES